MAARWKLVQAFIREATEEANGSMVADPATAYSRLRAVQKGAYTEVSSGNGLVQLTSRIGETEFSFAVPDGIGPAEIMEIAETALQLIEGRTVAQMRALLVRRKNSANDFSQYRL
jgi:hypothetical protein